MNDIDVNFENNRVICPKMPNSYIPSRHLPIPDIKLRVEGEEVTVLIDNREGFQSASELTEVGQRIYQCKISEIHKIPHEMVGLCATGSCTDQPISTIIGNPTFGENLTPDFISKRGKNYFIVEFKTSRGASSDIMKSIHTQGLARYEHVLQEKVTHEFGIHFSCICVSYSLLYTALELSSTQVDTMVWAFRVGSRIIDLAKERGHFIENLEELSNEVRDLKTEVHVLARKIKLFEGNSNFKATEDDMEFWRKEMADKEIELKERLVKLIDKKVEAAGKASWSSTSEGQKKTLVELVKEAQKDKEFSTIEKSVIKFPYFEIVGKPSQSVIEPEEVKGDCALTRVYKRALAFCNKKYKEAEDQNYQISKEELDLNVERIISNSASVKGEPDSDYKKVRSEEFRIKISLDGDDEKELAAQGIRAKKLLGHDRIYFEKKEKDKLMLDIDINTDDIDSFVNKTRNDSIYKRAKYCRDRNDAKKLMEKGFEMSGCVNNPLHMMCFSHLKNVSETNLFQYLDILNEIIREVNYSRNHFVKPKEYIIKKIKGLRLYLLIRPTDPTNKIFFSLLGHTEDLKPGLKGLFRHYFREGNLWFTQFASLDSDKISHYLNVKEKALSLYFTCKDISNDTKEWYLKKEPEFFNICLLVLLEDKPKTSEALMIIRHMYMNILYDTSKEINPFSVAEKFPVYPRSRLLIYCYHRITKAMNKMIKVRPLIQKVNADGNVAQDTMINLISWTTMRPVPNFQRVLNDCYLSHLHNKDEQGSIQGLFSIINKLVEVELKKREVRSEYTGREVDENLDYRYFEFDYKLILGTAMKTREFIENQGVNLDEHCYEVLARKRTQDYATLKSSCATKSGGQLALEKVFEEMNSARVEPLYTREEITHMIEESFPNLRTTKCLSAVYKLLEEGKVGTRAFAHIGKLIKLMEDQGGAINVMFKKPQQGGPREITILDIVSRICINFIESLFRSLSDFMPSEMMTKPEKKKSIADEHYKLVNQQDFKYKSTVSSSSDATKWCQRWNLKGFSAFITGLFSPELAKVCVKILNLMADRKVYIQPELLKEFSKRPELVSEKEGINEMKRQFLFNSGVHDIMDSGSQYLKIETGMGQGILHYLSSFIHCAVNEQAVELSRIFAKHIFKHWRQNARIEMISIQSSDDSMKLMTACFPQTLEEIANHTHPNTRSKTFAKERSKILIQNTLETFLRIIEDLMPCWMMKCSTEKSTIANSTEVFEFNSTWNFKNTTIVPLLKFCINPCRNIVASSVSGRRSSFYNLLRDIVENSGSLYLTHIIQILQAFSHYNALGANSSPSFKVFKKILMEKPLDFLGFFLFEPPPCIGIMGMDYCKYINYSQNEELIEYQHTLVSSEISGDWEIGQSQALAHLSFSSKEKYMKLKKELDANEEEIKEFYDQNPKKLYYPPESTNDLKVSLRDKICNRNIADSLSRINDAKFSSSAVYILDKRCIYYSGAGSEVEASDTIENVDNTIENVKPKRKRKKCLIEIAHSLKKKSFSSTEKRMAFMEIYFKDSLLHQEVFELNEEISQFLITVSTRFRNRTIKLSIAKEGIPTMTSFMKIVKHLWFDDHKVSISTTRLNRDLEILHQAYPWFDETNINKTLLNSPFNCHQSLANFIRNHDQRDKMVKVIGPIKRFENFISQLKEVLTMTWLPRIKLTEVVEDEPSSEELDRERVIVRRKKKKQPKRLKRTELAKRNLETDNLNKKMSDLRSKIKMAAHLIDGHAYLDEILDSTNFEDIQKEVFSNMRFRNQFMYLIRKLRAVGQHHDIGNLLSISELQVMREVDAEVQEKVIAESASISNNKNQYIYLKTKYEMLNIRDFHVPSLNYASSKLRMEVDKARRTVIKIRELNSDLKKSLDLYFEKGEREEDLNNGNRLQEDIDKEVKFLNKTRGIIYSLMKKEGLVAEKTKSGMLSKEFFKEEVKPLLDCMSGGRYGHFIQPQKFDEEKKKYSGMGIFSGQIHGKRFKLEIHDDKFHSLTLNTRDLSFFQTHRIGLSSFMKEVFPSFVKFSDRQSLSGLYFDFKNDRVTSMRTSMSVPIKQGVVNEICPDYVYYELTDYGNLRLKGMLVESNWTVRNYVINSMRILNDTTCEREEEAEGEIRGLKGEEQNWYKYSRAKGIKSFYKLCSDNSKIKDAFENKLVALGLTRGISIKRGQPPIQPKVDVTTDSKAMTDFFQDFLNQDSNEIFQKFSSVAEKYGAAVDLGDSDIDEEEEDYFDNFCELDKMTVNSLIRQKTSIGEAQLEVDVDTFSMEQNQSLETMRPSMDTLISEIMQLDEEVNVENLTARFGHIINFDTNDPGSFVRRLETYESSRDSTLLNHPMFLQFEKKARKDFNNIRNMFDFGLTKNHKGTYLEGLGKLFNIPEIEESEDEDEYDSDY